MSKFWLPLLVTFSLFECFPCKLSPEQVCGKPISNSRTIKLFVSTRKNQSREWDSFAALAESSNTSDVLDVEMTHTVFECDSKRSIFVQGVTNVSRPTASEDRFPLYFHVRCGINAAISENRRSGHKIREDVEYESQLFTHRPLMNGEIFEVRLDKKGTKKRYSTVGIGIITRSPDSVDIKPEMRHTPDAWVYLNNAIYSNSSTKKPSYGKNIDYVKVGERVAVMWTESGKLKFFVNGEDQGFVDSNITSPVYGLVELYADAQEVSIVSSSIPS